MAYRNYSSAVSHIVDTTGQGDFSTIQAAITAALAGSTIFIRPGTYTENLTLKAGVNLTAFGSDSSLNGTGDVIINGTCTLTTAGTVTISGIQLQTNSAALLAVTGTLASVVNLNNCYLNCSNNTGIIYSSSNASSGVNINNCFGDIGTTGISLFTSTSAGQIKINYARITNSGSSTTASTSSTALIVLRYAYLDFPLSVTSTGSIDGFCSAITNEVFNATALTTAGTGISSFTECAFTSGTASAVSVGTGSTVRLFTCQYSSSNTNALTGAGTLFTIACMAYGSSHLNNVTTTTGSGAMTGLTNGVAPAAGMLGEQIRSAVTNVSISNNTQTNVTSISLTAGIWDVSALIEYIGTLTGTGCAIGISTTSATLPGLGDARCDLPIVSSAASACGLTVPAYRITVTTTTTVYLIGYCNFTVGSCTANGRISATRVG